MIVLPPIHLLSVVHFTIYTSRFETYHPVEFLESVVKDIAGIEVFEKFFWTEIALRRTRPSFAARKLFARFPLEISLRLCIAMTAAATSLEEWRQHIPSKEWSDWERTAYWSRISDPRQYYSKVELDLEEVIFDIYQTVSIIACDVFVLTQRGLKDVRAVDMLRFWYQINDTHFRN